MHSRTGYQTKVAGSSVKALHCAECGAILATTESPHDLYSWAYRAYRWNHIGERVFCDSCS
jgi:hypothetical protein